METDMETDPLPRVVMARYTKLVQFIHNKYGTGSTLPGTFENLVHDNHPEYTPALDGLKSQLDVDLLGEK